MGMEGHQTIQVLDFHFCIDIHRSALRIGVRLAHLAGDSLPIGLHWFHHVSHVTDLPAAVEQFQARVTPCVNHRTIIYEALRYSEAAVILFFSYPHAGLPKVLSFLVTLIHYLVISHYLVNNLFKQFTPLDAAIKMIVLLFSLIAGFSHLVSAHGIVTSIMIGTKTYQGYDPNFQYMPTPPPTIGWASPPTQVCNKPRS
jgi:hypothetical protein